MTAIQRVDAPTERRNPRTASIDSVPTQRILELLNAEDATVPGAVAKALPDLARAVDLAYHRVRAGGRVHYFGAGTSGRIGVLDAAELPPTFSVDPGLVTAHHAGGLDALGRAAEGVEDVEALPAVGLRRDDVAVGLTASGRTPYVAGALATAREAGAATVLVSANPQAPLASLADVHVSVDTGAEAIAGSTRLKAGTAQKLVLNAFSTALMIRLGRTFSNLMVCMAPGNAKLRGRAITLLTEASGAGDAMAHAALEAAEGETAVALLMLLADTDVETARATLRAHGGWVRDALRALERRPPA